MQQIAHHLTPLFPRILTPMDAPMAARIAARMDAPTVAQFKGATT